MEAPMLSGPKLNQPAPGLRPGRSGPARCARSINPLLAYGRAARAPLAALAQSTRSWPTAGPLGPRSLRSLNQPAPGLRPGRSGPARCARSINPLLAYGRAARAPLAALAHGHRLSPPSDLSPRPASGGACGTAPDLQYSGSIYRFDTSER